jgi:hypothetical protein
VPVFLATGAFLLGGGVLAAFVARGSTKLVRMKEPRS